MERSSYKIKMQILTITTPWRDLSQLTLQLSSKSRASGQTRDLFQSRKRKMKIKMRVALNFIWIRCLNLINNPCSDLKIQCRRDPKGCIPQCLWSQLKILIWVPMKQENLQLIKVYNQYNQLILKIEIAQIFKNRIWCFLKMALLGFTKCQVELEICINWLQMIY